MKRVDDVAMKTAVTSAESIIRENSDVFSGIGQFKKPYHIETKPEIKGSIQPARKVPFAKYDKLKAKLEDLKTKELFYI
jgi:hypothetical protein